MYHRIMDLCEAGYKEIHVLVNDKFHQQIFAIGFHSFLNYKEDLEAVKLKAVISYDKFKFDDIVLTIETIDGSSFRKK